MADQLVTPDQVKARIFPAGPTDSVDDTLITEMIEQVTDWIQHYTSRQFVAVASATYILDTDGGWTLRYPKGIRAVSELKINTLAHQPPTGGSYVTLAATDYQLAGQLFGGPYTEIRLGRWTNYYFNTVENGASLTATTGFETVPPDIQSVCIDAVVAAYNVRKMGASGVVGAEDTAVVPWTQFFSRGSPQRGTLDRYRHWGVG